MKIVLATGIYPPQIGGPATYAKLLFDELPKKGIEVEIANFGDFLNLPKGLRHLMYFLKLWRSAKSANLVFTQDLVSAGLSALVTAKLQRKKLLVRVPGDYAWEQATQRLGVTDSIDDFQNKRYGWRVEILRWIQKRVVDGADQVITPSVYFRNLVSKWCRLPEKVVAVYNGIEFSPCALSKEEARKRLQLDDSLLMVSAGRLVPWKGFEFLVRLLPKLSEAWKLIVVGEGPDRSVLEGVVRDLGLEDRVTLTGAVPREKLLTYLAGADVFVLNTAFESFSFQVVEAMNQGVPVVTTRIGNLSEIISDGEEGFLVPLNDEKGFLEAINRLVADSDLRDSIVKKARGKSLRFSVAETLDRVSQIVNKLTKK